MKRVYDRYLAITVLVMTVAFTSCKKDKDEPKTFIVTFESNGGSIVANQTVNDGEKANKPVPDPTKANNIFDGWFTDNNSFENEWDFDTHTVTSNIIMYAKWNLTFTVTFDSNSGSAVQPQILLVEEKITKPENPVREGYWFIGWFIGDTEWDFNTVVTSNTTLVAKWNLKVLDFISYNGNTYKFEYDNQNRLTMYSSFFNNELRFTKTFIYNGNDLVRTEIEYGEDSVDIQVYNKQGNRITITLNNLLNDFTEYILDLDNDGYPVSLEKRMYAGGHSTFYTHEYQNGNLIKIMGLSGSHETHYDCNYDDKKSPFYNCTTPVWYMFTFSNKEYDYFPFPFYFPFLEFASKNNGLRDMYSQDFYKYEYDSDGFPTIRTNITKQSVTEFRYKK